MTTVQHPLFSYKLIRSRRKTTAIIVNARGEVTVRAPLRANRELVEAFVHAKRDWILARLDEAGRRAGQNPAHRFEPGELFPFQGHFYPLELVPLARIPLEFEGSAFRLSTGTREQARQAFTDWYRARAREILPAQVSQLARRYGFVYQNLRVTSARTRWGSCNSRGTLSFSWRTVALPPELLAYVVIHELCHLRQPNHSPAFWAEVEHILPDMRARRKALAGWGGQVSLD